MIYNHNPPHMLTLNLTWANKKVNIYWSEVYTKYISTKAWAQGICLHDIFIVNQNNI